MLVMIQQSTDGGTTWTDVAPLLTDNASNYQTTVPAPPAFGTVWYRANFTGIVPQDQYVTSILNGSTPLDMALFQKLQSSRSYWLNGRVLWIPPTGEPYNGKGVTDPIAVSSASTDAMVVGIPIIIIIIAIVAVVVMRSRKKPAK
jgi:hypothetical protein